MKKIAYFSPMPPARTGIASYSSFLVPSLCARAEVAVFSPGPTSFSHPGVEVHDFVNDPWCLKDLDHADAVIYHLGNNPWFHLDILKVLKHHPGTVVLHDLVLYFLMAGRGVASLFAEFLRQQGPARAEEVWRIVQESPHGDILQYGKPEDYPLAATVLGAAAAIIVHNNVAAAELKKAGVDKPITVVPLMACSNSNTVVTTDEVRSARESIGASDRDVIIGFFGFIGPTKRMDKAFLAIRRLIDEDHITNVRILVVGDGLSLTSLVESTGLGQRVHLAAFASDDMFRRYLAASDIVCNLRYPTMGESSASLVQAMAYGKPTLVTDDASFLELPDDVVLKVSYGPTEVDEIKAALLRLVQDASLRARIGLAAQAYTTANHSADYVARRYIEAASDARARAESRATPQSSTACREWARAYASQRVKALFP